MICAWRGLPTALDREAAGFEERLKPVGLVALDFEGAAVELTAAAEGRFQFAQEILQLCGVPRGGESFEHENGFAAAVRGGTTEEEVLGGFFFLCGSSGCRCTGSFAQGAKVERGKGIGAQLGCGVGGDALFLFPRHG